MPRLIPALLLTLLAACTQTTRLDGFRNQGPIYSNAVLDLRLLQGTWTQAAAFSTSRATCHPGGAEIATTPTGLAIRARLCLNGSDIAYSGPLAITGPGRLRPMGQAAAPLNRDWWLLWADTDLRTLVLGTPDGSFGFILNRGGPLSPDRLAAARDILDWNGYDISRLATFTR
ncbi:lipocalin family protein [Fuscovulum ytuae]|uniref:Lipocalin family protein n=1 Tax=Fuscovulum ytuae TaxID=3042299 RepID=A0ABY8Q6F5_9RHOB|nr:lipocalin family protein [Fuscovulum sp. YMD61]WGV15895.1 lipocalin family protein [Fuscovulum sp. YMD61]